MQRKEFDLSLTPRRLGGRFSSKLTGGAVLASAGTLAAAAALALPASSEAKAKAKSRSSSSR
jgi:hypothetical protein